MNATSQPRPGRIEIVETSAPQPWHVRFIGGNGEPIASGENLSSEQDAETAVLAIARMFGATEPVIHRSGETGRAVVLGGRRAADLVYLDERALPQEPPC